MPIPRRLRSFSLRTLLVLVGAACVLAAWVARERRFVLERRAALAKWETADRSVSAYSAAGATGKQHDGSDWPTVHWLRHWLGDVPIYSIRIRRFNGARVARIRRLFPEAIIET